MQVKQLMYMNYNKETLLTLFEIIDNIDIILLRFLSYKK